LPGFDGAGSAFCANAGAPTNIADTMNAQAQRLANRDFVM
jgi:hypothetical protein